MKGCVVGKDCTKVRVEYTGGITFEIVCVLGGKTKRYVYRSTFFQRMHFIDLFNFDHYLIMVI